MSRRILLSGVHGVGKGYFINNKLKDLENITVISASEIISRYHDAEDAGNKRVKDVEDNQRILFEALTNLFIEHTETVVLDGHLVILDSNDNIQRIPKIFFEKEMFDSIILLQDDSRLVYERLFARDGIHKLEMELISKIQESEKEYAMELEKEGVVVCYITPSSCETAFQLMV